MAMVGNVVATVSANTKPFTTAMDRATKSARGFGAGVADVAAKVAKVGAVAIAGGAIAATAAVTAMTKSGLASVDALAKQSDAIGIATEKLAGLRHAADITGAGADALDKSLLRMQKSIADAGDGLATPSRAFESLGLKVSELAAMSPDQQFYAIADAVASIRDPAARTQAVLDIFGRSGGALINTLSGGSEALAGFQAGAEKLGLAVNRVDAAKVEMANDALTRMGRLITGLGQTFAVQLAPIIQTVADKITNWATEGEGVQKKIGDVVRKIAVGVINLGASIAETALGIVNTIVKSIQEPQLAILNLQILAKEAVRDARSALGATNKDLKPLLKDLQSLKSQRAAIEKGSGPLGIGFDPDGLAARVSNALDKAFTDSQGAAERIAEDVAKRTATGLAELPPLDIAPPTIDGPTLPDKLATNSLIEGRSAAQAYALSLKSDNTARESLAVSRQMLDEQQDQTKLLDDIYRRLGSQADDVEVVTLS